MPVARPGGDFRSWKYKKPNGQNEELRHLHHSSPFSLSHRLPPQKKITHGSAGSIFAVYAATFPVTCLFTRLHFCYTIFGLKWRGRSLWHLLASLSHVETPQITKCKRYRSTHVRSLAQTLGCSALPSPIWGSNSVLTILVIDSNSPIVQATQSSKTSRAQQRRSVEPRNSFLKHLRREKKTKKNTKNDSKDEVS